MKKKIKVYRRSFWNNDRETFQYAIGFSMFTEALSEYDLAKDLIDRKAKYDYYGRPTCTDLTDYTAEYFTFRFKRKDRYAFMLKLSALKDDPEIAKFFWIGG